jgi:hypothetical protein
LGHSRKHPYHPHGGNRKLTPLPPSDVLIHLLLSETLFSPLPLRTAEISSVGGSMDLFWNDPLFQWEFRIIPTGIPLGKNSLIIACEQVFVSKINTYLQTKFLQEMRKFNFISIEIPIGI